MLRCGIINTLNRLIETNMAPNGNLSWILNGNEGHHLFFFILEKFKNVIVTVKQFMFRYVPRSTTAANKSYIIWEFPPYNYNNMFLSWITNNEAFTSDGMDLEIFDEFNQDISVLTLRWDIYHPLCMSCWLCLIANDLWWNCGLCLLWLWQEHHCTRSGDVQLRSIRTFR